MPEIHKKPKQWTDIHSQYKATEILGQGTYGVVYRGEKRTHDGKGATPVALKRSRLDLYAENGLPETALREVTLLHDLKHENILRLHNISCTTSRLYMVCEYLDMDLKKYIRSKGRAVAYDATKRIVYEVLKGVAFCHGHRVIHRDLKPHNILLDEGATRIKLADFGLARPKHGAGKTLTHEVVTLWYRAPELLLGHCNYDDSVDIWSIGCILAELLSGQPLFPGDSEIDTLFKIFRLLGTPSEEDWPLHAVESLSSFPKLEGKADPFGGLHSLIDESGKELLSRMLRYNPKRRIAAHEALEHPWFHDVRALLQTPVPALPEPVASARSSGNEPKGRAVAKPRPFRIRRPSLLSGSSVPSTLASSEKNGSISSHRTGEALAVGGDDVDMASVSGSTLQPSDTCGREGLRRSGAKRPSMNLEDVSGNEVLCPLQRNSKRAGGVPSAWDWSMRSERVDTDNKENIMAQGECRHPPPSTGSRLPEAPPLRSCPAVAPKRGDARFEVRGMRKAAPGAAPRFGPLAAPYGRALLQRQQERRQQPGLRGGVW